MGVRWVAANGWLGKRRPKDWRILRWPGSIAVPWLPPRSLDPPTQPMPRPTQRPSPHAHNMLGQPPQDELTSTVFDALQLLPATRKANFLLDTALSLIDAGKYVSSNQDRSLALMSPSGTGTRSRTTSMSTSGHQDSQRPTSLVPCSPVEPLAERRAISCWPKPMLVRVNRSL